MNKFDQDALIYRANKEIQFHDYLKKVRTNFNCDKISYYIEGYNFVDGYVYYPRNSDDNQKFEVIIDMHGGGNVLGQFELDDKYCQLVADQTGKVVINLDYLLAPEYKFPGPIESTYQFLVKLVNDSDKYNFDCSQLTLMGHSAGGYISACIAVMNKNKQQLNIEKIIANYAPFVQDQFDSFDGSSDSFADRIVQYRKWYFNTAEECSLDLATPLNADLHEMPPMFIISASKDILQTQELEFAKKLNISNSSVIHKLFDDCFHGFTHEAFSEYNPQQSEIAWNDIINYIKGDINKIEGLTEL